MADHGDFVRFELGTTRYYLFNRPAQVRQLFVESLDRLQKPAYLRDSNRGRWGDGLTTLEALAWRSRRARVRPVFRADALARHLAIVTECAGDLVASWRAGQTIELRAALRTLTARIAARVILDAEVEGFGSPEANRRRSGLIRFEEALGEDFTSVMKNEPVAPLSLTRPRAPANMDSTLAILEARFQSREDRGDTLSLLLDAAGEDGSRLTREEITGEIVQMLFAGHHTFPGTLVRFCEVLAQNPEVARRARASVADEAVAASSAAGATPYLELVLKETMRVFPPAPILYREVKIPFEMEGHRLEPGAAVWVCPQLLHHDPRNFAAPEVFRPERFERDAAPGVPEYAYLPFGAGPRTCVANRLALAQMSRIAAILVRRASLVPKSDAPEGELFEVDAIEP